MKLPALLILAGLLTGTTGTTYSHLYPFGEDAGDELLPAYDDGYVELERTRAGYFFFYGQRVTNVTINANGMITFDENNWLFNGGMATFPFDSNQSPFDVDDRIIAPFMEDVLANHAPPSSNRVWYRQEHLDQVLLDRAAADVAQAFPCDSGRPFRPQWMLVATWDEVKHFYYYYEYCYYDLEDDCMEPHYEAHDECDEDCEGDSQCISDCWDDLQPGYEECATYICLDYEYNDEDLYNTFQVVLMTDGIRTFAFFNYGDIQWTGAYDGDHAQVGFNHGDGYRAHSLPVSLTPAVADLDFTSNVGVPGRHAFRVDRPFIKDGACAPDVCICQFGNSQYGFYNSGGRLVTLIDFQSAITGYDMEEPGAVDLADYGEEDDPCRFRLVAHVTHKENTHPDLDHMDQELINAVFYFGVGVNGKYKRNVKIGGASVKERGQGIGGANTIEKNSIYEYNAGGTHVRLVQHDTVILIQSDSCPYEVEYHKRANPKDLVTLSAGSNAAPISGICGACVV